MKIVIDIPDEEYELDKRMADSGMGSPAIRRILNGTPYEERKGKWINRTEDGYVECPVCGHLTTCGSEDEIKDLHYCFWCGTRMEVYE